MKVYGGLQSWESNNRWDSIWLAGQRDEESPTIFDKIIAGDIPAFVVKEDSDIIAFKDINPAAPSHVLVIPKDRNGLSCLRKSSAEHVEILGKLLVAAGEIASDSNLGFGDGARIVINDGKVRTKRMVKFAETRSISHSNCFHFIIILSCMLRFLIN